MQLHRDYQVKLAQDNKFVLYLSDLVHFCNYFFKVCLPSGNHPQIINFN